MDRAHTRTIILSILMVFSFSIGFQMVMPSPGHASNTCPDLRIGFLVKTLGNPTWQDWAAGARAAGERLDVDITVKDVPTEGAQKKQLDVARTMITQGFDAIVAASITNTNLIPAIKSANEQGVSWIVVSESQDPEVLETIGAEPTARVQLDFYTDGVLAAEYVAKVLDGEGKVAYIRGMSGTSATRQRTQGYKDVFAEYPGITAVANQAADWMREKARQKAATIIQGNPGLDALLVNNDGMALGAAKAVEQAGKQGDILVTGHDGTKNALQALARGDLTATVNGNPWYNAWMAVHAAVQAQVEGPEGVENYDFRPSLVTEDNVQKVLQSHPVPTEQVWENQPNPYWPIQGCEQSPNPYISG